MRPPTTGGSRPGSPHRQGARHRRDGAAQSRLTVARAGLFGTDSQRVFQVVPSKTGAPTVTTVVDGLGAQIYSYPLITASPTGDALYTIKGRDLVRIEGLR